MVSRTAFYQLKHSSLLLLCTIAGMVITYLAPPLLLLTGSRLEFLMGAAAWAAMTMTYSTMVRYYRLNPHGHWPYRWRLCFIWGRQCIRR
jgi:hypothetical protein